MSFLDDVKKLVQKRREEKRRRFKKAMRKAKCDEALFTLGTRNRKRKNRKVA